MNVELIKSWIESHQPQGVTKLCGKCEISPGTLHKILREGHSPGVDIARKMANAIGVSLDEICTPDFEAPASKAQ